jgi:hypothetical protein
MFHVYEPVFATLATIISVWLEEVPSNNCISTFSGTFDDVHVIV